VLNKVHGMLFKKTLIHTARKSVHQQIGAAAFLRGKQSFVSLIKLSLD
jgi:hypothetical protein